MSVTVNDYPPVSSLQAAISVRSFGTQGAVPNPLWVSNSITFLILTLYKFFQSNSARPQHTCSVIDMGYAILKLVVVLLCITRAFSFLDAHSSFILNAPCSLNLDDITRGGPKLDFYQYALQGQLLTYHKSFAATDPPNNIPTHPMIHKIHRYISNHPQEPLRAAHEHYREQVRLPNPNPNPDSNHVTQNNLT